MTSLYDPIVLGDLNLGNRVFMAPLTRNRAMPNGVPGPWAPTYYSQRASAGRIVLSSSSENATDITTESFSRISPSWPS